MSAEQLLPCPFCASYGDDVRITGAVDSIWVTCDTCGGQTDIHSTVERAVAFWNRRNGVLSDDALTMPEPEPEDITTEDVLAAELRRLNELADCGHENRFRYTGKAGTEHCARCEVRQMHNICAGYHDREQVLIEAVRTSLHALKYVVNDKVASQISEHLERALETVGAK